MKTIEGRIVMNELTRQDNSLPANSFRELALMDKQLHEAISLTETFIEKKYLSDLSLYRIKDVPEHIKRISIKENIRMVKLKKLVYDKNEDTLDKLNTVYNTIWSFSSSLFLIIDSDGNKTDFYIGIRNDEHRDLASAAIEGLKKSFQGNFPGTDIETLNCDSISSTINCIIDNKNSFISSVSGIPGLRDEDKNNFVQGIEKLVDSMRGRKFSAILIADPLTHRNIEEIKEGYETIYSKLSSFASREITLSINDSEALSKNLTKGFTETVNESLSKTQSFTSSGSSSISSSYSSGKSITENQNTTFPWLGVIYSDGLSIGTTGSYTSGHTTTQGLSDTRGTSDTKGIARGISEQEGTSETYTKGKTRSTQIQFENKKVKNLLAKIEEQLERIKSSESFGMWNCSAYFIAEDKPAAKVAAGNFKALLRGENSSLEYAFINTWSREKNDSIKFLEYLKKLYHPLFDINIPGFPFVTPGSLISGNELVIPFGLPKKSLNGLPVLEYAEFGRNIITYKDRKSERKITSGKIYHMGKKEKTDLHIDLDSLTLHTFVTGSTGSGKSNTVYQIVHKAIEEGVKILIIEPAKGEYKNVFGGRDDFYVYGTNPEYSPMLRINPFIFPASVHVLEHIDRLIEIFNACWPMYAAMPAVLKKSIERAYEISGWDMEHSINHKMKYPTFKELLRSLKTIIKESEFSEEVKSNYIGALETRVESLTNGLVGTIFSGAENACDRLFDENCIVDLSRIGSTETKALIMGMLFIKLHEYRFSEPYDANSSLKHLTVIEEAHNLLRRTSSEQSQESSNLQGKSVEMISNAISEMRTCGEGFIIVDQSPGLLDMSAIRNTNTKIIMRLPDESDRQLVGRSANLNDGQIKEIAKFKTGVAAVYQNDWIEPVLCQIEEFTDRKPYKYKEDMKEIYKLKRQRLAELLKLLLNGRLKHKGELKHINVTELKKWLKDIVRADLYSELLKEFDNYSNNMPLDLWKEKNFEKLSEIISSFIDLDRLMRLAKETENLNEWNKKILEGLYYCVDLEHNEEFEKSVIQCLLSEKARQDKDFKDFYFLWVERARQDRWH